MLEPIRQYAREKLEEIGEADAVRRRHADFSCALRKKPSRSWPGRSRGSGWSGWTGEHDNLGAALSWALERGEDELGCGSARRCGDSGTPGLPWRGVRWLEQVLAAGDPAPSARIEALEGMGWLAQREGGAERAEATYEEMLDLSRELGDEADLATALNSLGTLALARGDNERATALLEENLAVLRGLEEETPPRAQEVPRAQPAGYLALTNGDYARGTTLWEESLALAGKRETPLNRANPLQPGVRGADAGRPWAGNEVCEEALVRPVTRERGRDLPRAPGQPGSRGAEAGASTSVRLRRSKKPWR